MTFRNILAGLLLSAFTLGLPAVEPEPKKPAEQPDAGKKAAPKARARGQAERTCALTITWWEMPVLAEGEFLELGVQGERDVTPIYPSAMTPSGTFLYEGPAGVAIVRKGKIPDPSGKPGAKPVDTWLPFTSFTLGPDDREALVIMFALEGAGKVMTRKFNINVENFPFGGFDVLNYSKSRLLCSMGGKVFYAEPSGRSRSPLVMAKREVVNFFMGVTEADGSQRLIYRAPLILHEKNRRLYFVLEDPNADPEHRFVAHTLIQHVSGHKTIETLRGQFVEEEPKAPAKKEPATKKEPTTATDGTPKAQ